MQQFSAYILLYLVHQIGVAEAMMLLAQSQGAADLGVSPRMQNQIAGVMQLAETVFSPTSIGRCRQHVLTAKSFLEDPTLTPSSAQPVLHRLIIDILQDLGEDIFLRIAPRHKSVDYKEPLDRWGKGLSGNRTIFAFRR